MENFINDNKMIVTLYVSSPLLLFLQRNQQIFITVLCWTLSIGCDTFYILQHDISVASMPNTRLPILYFILHLFNGAFNHYN
jgi:hypothetical protein